MTIQEAIDKRIERFNRLYFAATGHTFEEDEQWCEEQNKIQTPAWEAQVKERLEQLGYESSDAYFEAYYKNPKEVYDEDFVAKRMEVGAVIAAAPKENVVRVRPESGDIIGRSVLVLLLTIHMRNSVLTKQ